MIAVHHETAGPLHINTRANARQRLAVLARAVREWLPREWQGAIDKRARAKAAQAAAAEAAGRANGLTTWTTRPKARGDVLADMLARYSGARAADMSEADIRQRAEVLAERARKMNFSAAWPTPWDAWGSLCEWVASNGGVIALTTKAKTLTSWAARASCARWWRRQLRRYVARLYEAGAYELGRVGADTGQWYCSDRAVIRRVQQVRANDAMLKATAIENEAGQQMTLWDCAQRSVSNKTIRRGELMTRIRGCEEWADAAGLVGLFTTNTCPSRFHSQRKGGGANPNYDGSTPAKAQKWLSTQWARLRAKWARDGIKVMGFRVAEPHHDGCPHWHMLIWCQQGDADEVADTMRAWWLKDSGEEPGAAEHRCRIKKMERGGAAGYIAKYIAKNIDDAQVGEHMDDEAPALSVGPDLLGDLEVKPSMRVEAWASMWAIRQFQPIGQPPVTVWRELRRVTLQQAGAGSDALIHAWIAAHRERDRRADWCKYMRAQGGAMLARRDYRLCVHHVGRQVKGRYETTVQAWACGVTDARRAALHVLGAAAPVTPSQRRQWGGAGFAAAHRAAPWTSFNNCTRHNRADVGDAMAELENTRRRLGLGADWNETGPP